MEQVARAATGVIDALKTQPAMLALTLGNFALLGFMYYGLQGAAASREAIIKQVLDNSNSIHEMMERRAVGCPAVPSGGWGGLKWGQ
jgi:hypothetical protein